MLVVFGIGTSGAAGGCVGCETLRYYDEIGPGCGRCGSIRNTGYRWYEPETTAPAPPDSWRCAILGVRLVEIAVLLQ